MEPLSFWRRTEVNPLKYFRNPVLDRTAKISDLIPRSAGLRITDICDLIPGFALALFKFDTRFLMSLVSARECATLRASTGRRQLD